MNVQKYHILNTHTGPDLDKTAILRFLWQQVITFFNLKFWSYILTKAKVRIYHPTFY